MSGFPSGASGWDANKQMNNGQTIRAWKVLSSSKSDGFEILGENLTDAIKNNIGTILEDLFWKKFRGVALVSAKWQTGIFDGIGGTEMSVFVPNIDGKRGLPKSQYFVWIDSSPADMPKPVTFTFSA